eukprot:scaffold6226_cov118-Cylindrotheca_fusiformis.AAC.4
MSYGRQLTTSSRQQPWRSTSVVMSRQNQDDELPQEPATAAAAATNERTSNSDDRLARLIEFFESHKQKSGWLLKTTHDMLMWPGKHYRK